ncbi:MAG: hypothetical protein ACK5KQ_06080 [Anaerorhabdus sp.]
MIQSYQSFFHYAVKRLEIKVFKQCLIKKLALRSKKWSATTIHIILINEKYKGDALLQIFCLILTKIFEHQNLTKGIISCYMWSFTYCNSWLLCVLAFILSFVCSAAFKMTHKPEWSKNYSVQWSDEIGTVHTDLAKVQNYFDTAVLEVDEEKADIYQQILKENIPKFKEQAGAYLFIWDGLPWYDDPRNLTAHTIIATPYVFAPFDGLGVSIAEWLENAVNGRLQDYGLDFVDKEY